MSDTITDRNTFGEDGLTDDVVLCVSKEQAEINRLAYFWNTAAGLLVAFQSVIMLMVLMRVCDTATAGVFTIAYASANLFLNVGKFGMRNFQVSDVKPHFSFGDYALSRIVTSMAMVACSVLYLAWSATSFGYDIEKTLVILFMCLFKFVDAVEDVFHANYQQFGRLDVAGRVLALRIGTTLAVFSVGTFIMQDLLMPLIASTMYTALFFMVSTIYIRRYCGLPRRQGAGKWASVVSLLKECFPLFLAAFLLYYIGSAPKYAIDAFLGDAEQAYYGFISMPVFVVGLLASFVYAPIIASVSRSWERKDKRGFVRVFVQQILIVVAITVACDVATLVAGVPVLSVMYNTDLSPYLVELIVLVSGGGFLALAALFTLGITIVRQQRKLIWGYLGVSLLALWASPLIVQKYGITGASWEYFVLMAGLSVWFGVLFAWVVFRGKNRTSKGVTFADGSIGPRVE